MSAFVPAPYAVVRFNLVPAPAGDAGLTARLARLAALTTDIHARGTVLADRIAARVATAPPAQRRALLALRRDIHNGRMPASGTVVDPGWLAAFRELDRLTAELVDADDAAVRGERARLFAVCADPDFQAATATTSGTLWRAAALAAGEPPAAPGKRTRKSEPGLLKYALRAAAKTSPFSRYTGVALGWWEQGTGRATTDVPVDAVDSHVEPSHLAVRKLLRLAHADPAVRTRCAYRVARNVRVHDGRIRFEIDVDVADGPVRVDALAQRDVSMPADPATVGLLAAVGTAGGPVGYQRLVAMLAGDGTDGRRVAAAHGFVGRLIEVGLLRPDDGVPEQPADIIDAAARSLTALGHIAPAAHLRRVGVAAAALPGAPPSGRVGALEAARAAFADAFGHFDAVPSGGAALFEDAVTGKDVALDATAWQPVLRDLGEVLPVLRLFDNHVVMRALLTAGFTARHGAGATVTDVAGFARIIPDVVTRTLALSADTVDSDLPPAVADLIALRHAVYDAVRVSGRLPHEVLALAARLPEPARSAAASYSCFLQGAVTATGTQSAAVNHVYGGSGQYTSRFLRHFAPDAAARVAASVRATYPAGTLLAQQRPVLGFNANLHPLLAEVDLELDNAVDDTARPRLRLDELALRHDPDTDRLVLFRRRDGRPVEVLYLGFLVPYALPYHQSLLYLLSAWGQVTFNPHAEVERRLRDGGATGVHAYPRLTWGSVVLQRARWYVPAGDIPVRRPDESNGAYFVRVNRWRIATGLPARVFLAAGERGDPLRITFARPKPCLVDFESRLSVRHLSRSAADYGVLVLVEEALPDPCAPASAGGPLGVSHRGRHACELVVELHKGQVQP